MSYLSNTKYAASPANPYVYSHTLADIYKISDEIIETVNASDAGNDTIVQIIGDGGGYWPFPWYLRSLNKVGYWNSVDENMPAAPIVITVATSYDKRIDVLEGQVISHLYNYYPPGEKQLYVPLFNDYLEIRPYVEVRGYVTKKLWEQAQSNKQ